MRNAYNTFRNIFSKRYFTLGRILYHIFHINEDIFDAKQLNGDYIFPFLDEWSSYVSFEMRYFFIAAQFFFPSLFKRVAVL